MLHALRVTLTFAPLRGAEHWEQGGSSATAKAKLERDKRGTPLHCRKSGDFFGVKGSGEGINPFLRKKNLKKIKILNKPFFFLWNLREYFFVFVNFDR